MNKFRKISFIVLAVIAVAGLAAAAYYYWQYQSLKKNPNAEAQKETISLVTEVGKIMELPANETPTIATIADKDKLKDQSFFKSAQNGDKLLAYTKSMEAILYRPSSRKIIAVAPIVINNNQAANATSSVDSLPEPAN